MVGPHCTSVGVTSAPTLDGGYIAFQATGQKAGGNLHPTLTATATSVSIVHQGVIVPGTGYWVLHFLNKSGAVVGGYPSAAFVLFNGTASAGHVTVTGPEFTSDDGCSGCPALGPG